MTTNDDLKPGDFIDVLEAHRFGLDRWVSAEVVTVEAHSIGVRFMAGASAGALIALERHTENRLWKRANV